MYFAKGVAKNLQVNISEYERDVQFDAYPKRDLCMYSGIYLHFVPSN